MSAKYPRIPHLPWSPGGTNDDKRLDSAEHFVGVPIIITEKMDGSNLCMNRNSIFARSHSGPPTHKSFDQAKSLHASIKHYIDPNIDIFGEWVACVHSIYYNSLPSYFFVFGTRLNCEDMEHHWNEWEDVCATAKKHGLCTVPVLYKGTVKTIDELKYLTEDLANQKSAYGIEREGLVVRMDWSFEDKEFKTSIAKWVRADHVQTDEHWMYKPIRRQGLDEKVHLKDKRNTG